MKEKHPKVSNAEIRAKYSGLVTFSTEQKAAYVNAVRMAEEIRDDLDAARKAPILDENGNLSWGFVRFIYAEIRELNFRIIDANYLLAKAVLGETVHKSQLEDVYDKNTGIAQYIVNPPKEILK